MRVGGRRGGRQLQHLSLGGPVQQVVAFGQPRLVAAAVGAVLAVVAHVGHEPFGAAAEHRRTVELMVVVGRGDDETILEGRLHLLIDMFHDSLRHLLRSGTEASGREEQRKQMSFHNSRYFMKSQSTSSPAPISRTSRGLMSSEVKPATMMIPLGRLMVCCPLSKW